jgi:surfactin synthase thioesterase subunit
MSVSQNPWLAQVKPNPAARVRLFCIPFAGGDPSAFAGWAEGLPSSIEVCPVLLPGRWTRLKEPLFTDIVPLVRALGESLLPLLDKPFALFGHSTGALICFELTRWLRKRCDLQPAHLFPSGCGAPHLPARLEPIHRLRDQEFVEKLLSFQGIPEAVLAEPELRELILPILRADFQLSETYVYEDDRPLACPITAFGGSRDPIVDQSSFEAWREHTSGRFKLRFFPGDHMFLRTDGHSVLEAIGENLLSTPAINGVTKTN